MPYKNKLDKKENSRKWHENNKEKTRKRLAERRKTEAYKEYQRQYRERNRETAKQTSAQWRNKNGNDGVKNSILKTLYGITIEEYNRMSEQQLHTCAICKEPETAMFRGKPRKLAVDHCHKTGKIRGLLCWKCNTTLGRYGDDLYIWENFVTYLLSSLESTE